MADTRGIRAGRAYVELGVADKLTKGLEKAQARLKAFGEGLQKVGKGLAALGGSVLAPIMLGVKAFTEGGDAIAKMSKRTGIGVEALSELGFAADLCGVDMETLETGVRKMQKTLAEAATGSEGATQALGYLNLTVADLADLSPEQQLKLIADRLAAIKDPTVRAALAMEIFGKSGTKLIPLLQNGAAGIEALQKQARDLGLTMSAESAEAAEHFKDTLNILWRVVRKVSTTIASAVIPLLQEAADAAIRCTVSVIGWLRANKALVVTVFKIAVAVTAAGLAIAALGTAIIGVSKVIGWLATVTKTVGAGFSLMMTLIAGLANPVTLAIAAIVALGAVLLTCTDAGQKALVWLGEQFGALRDTVYKVVGGMADALAAGNLTLAAQVLWAGLKLAWEQGTHALLQVWLALKGKFLGIVNDFVYGGQALWVEFVAGVQSLWARLVGFLRSTWAKFSAWHARAVENTANWIAKRWLELQGLFDDTLDVAAAKESVDQQSQQRFDEIAAQEQADLTDIEKSKEQALAEAAKRRDERLAEIGSADVENERKQRAEHDQRLRDSQAELDKAKADLDAARAAAAQKRREVEGAAAPGRPTTDPLAGLDDRISGLADLMARKLSVAGTFNPLAAAGLGAADADERTARNTEQIARHTKRLADAAAVGRLSFT